MQFIFLKFLIFPNFLEKNKNLNFLINIYEIFSKFATYECLQLKNTESAINASGKSAIFFNLL